MALLALSDRRRGFRQARCTVSFVSVSFARHRLCGCVCPHRVCRFQKPTSTSSLPSDGTFLPPAARPHGAAGLFPYYQTAEELFESLRHDGDAVAAYKALRVLYISEAGNMSSPFFSKLPQLLRLMRDDISRTAGAQLACMRALSLPRPPPRPAKRNPIVLRRHAPEPLQACS